MTSRDIDGGWAWVVLFAAYINLLIGPGLAFVGGIFQAEFLEHFHESVSLTSWVTSLFASLLQLAGPLASMLSSQFSCRVSVMAGATLLSGGLAVSSFANNIYVLLVFMGVVSGVGLGLTYSPSVIIVNLYFVKRRTLVTGLALSASGTGILIFPILSRYLLDALSWRETLSVFAAVSLQMVVCGALMFPLHEQSNTSVCGKLCGRYHGGASHDTYSVEKHNVPDADLHGNTPKEQTEHLLQLPEEGSQNTASLKPKNISISNDVTSLETKTEKGMVDSDSLLLNHTLTSHRKPIYQNISFLILCCSLFLSNAAFGIFAIHFPSFATSFGVTPAEVAFALAMNGPALIISRILIGAMGDDEKIDPLSTYMGLTLISGMLISLVPIFSVTAARQCVTMALMGVYFGGSYSLLTVITIDCVGLDSLATAFGWEMIFAGCGYLVAPPIAGWIVDTTGLYSRSMYLSGLLLFISALTLLLIPICKKEPSQNMCRRHSNQSISVDIPAKKETS